MKNFIRKLLFTRIGAGKISIGLVVILFISSMNALVDFIIHPEIPFFDQEHIIVGSVTFAFCFMLGMMILFYLSWLQ